MRTLGFVRYAFEICAVAAVLSGCGGMQPPIRTIGAATNVHRALSWSATSSSVSHTTTGFKTIFNFDGTNGAMPAGLLVSNGILYGLTEAGGTYGGGIAFTLKPSGKESVIHNFGSGSDGNTPLGQLIFNDGNYYGATSAGGAQSLGTVFSLSPSGKERWLYSFNGAPDGAIPFGGLVDVNGTFYGTTGHGGTTGCNGNGCGTVFKVTATGREVVVYRFQGGNDGAYPNAPLASAGDRLYGAADDGGAYGWGTLFMISTSGSETTLHSFGPSSQPDGLVPNACPTIFDGKIYGPTFAGGKYNGGVVYKATEKGDERVLYDFGGYDKGTTPAASVVALNGNLYGTTFSGGAHGYGTIFELTTAGKLDVLYAFGENVNKVGVNPESALVISNGVLYGTTSGGGKYHQGTVFEYTL
jgi:uncharacterized repeat protein (TIGR03803 family)